MSISDRGELEQVAHKQASQSILKALDVIDVLVRAPGPMTPNALARALRKPVPTVHRLLRTLALRGWVDSVDGTYRLTLRVFEIGMSVVDKIDVVTEARPLCEELSRAVNETVNMSIRSGPSAVYVIKVESERSMRLISQLGMGVPLYCTAMGKAMLAYMEESEREDLLAKVKLEPRARNTITNREQLERELALILKRGWAVDNEEFDFGLICIGAPVFGRQGNLAGAVSLTGPSARIRQKDWPAFGRRVKETADRISIKLGYGIGTRVHSARTATGQ